MEKKKNAPRYYIKQTEGGGIRGGLHYLRVEEIEESKWVLITVNFDYKCNIEAAVGQHLIDQPEIKRADEILAGCEEIPWEQYSIEEYIYHLDLDDGIDSYLDDDDIDRYLDDDEEEKKKVVFSRATSKRRKPVPGAEPIEAIVFLGWRYYRYFNLIVEIEGELYIVKEVSSTFYKCRVPLKGEIVTVYWDKEAKGYKIVYWKSCRWKRVNTLKDQ